MDTLNGVLEIDFDGKLVMYERMEVMTCNQPTQFLFIKTKVASILLLFSTPQALHDVAKKPSLYRVNSGKRKVIFVGDPATYAMQSETIKPYHVRPTLSGSLRKRKNLHNSQVTHEE